MEPPEPNVRVPPDWRGAAWANDVYVYGEVDELTFDFVYLDPRDTGRGVVVARVAASRWCILKLRRQLETR